MIFAFEMGTLKVVRLFVCSVLLVGLCLGAAQAQQDVSSSALPKIYNHITEEGSKFDQIVDEIYKRRFTVVEIRDSPSYVDARVTEGSLPETARTETGEALGGYIAVAYLVSTDGRAAEPEVIKSTDPRLAAFALKSMEGWRFVSATLDGRKIPTIAVQEFNFERPPVSKPSRPIVVPDGFVLQVLEPLGGKIVRPKDWFYSESHGGPSFTWIISKEDTRKGRYDTGIRIQTLVGVQKGTGQSPKDFVMSFIAGKKKGATKVLTSCEATDQGLFSRICLEVEEGDYHIVYSAFWGNGTLDLVIVSTAGTKKEDWPTYAPIFNAMDSFELIDMARFEKQAKSP